jgi:prepilin signal peptidase PulO-like enzyme (type II secretory pathway)
MDAALVTYLGVIGAALGSFVDVLAWRGHTGRSVVTGRSECEACHHPLGPIDLVPVVSWVVLRGRCRYCGSPIGPLVPAVELGLAAAFALSALRWPQDLAARPGAIPGFVAWSALLVLLAVLSVHDVRWGSLPNPVLCALVPLVLYVAGERLAHSGTLTVTDYLARVCLGAAVSGGGYALLFAFSRGAWVGMGDVKLTALLGMALAWRDALLALAVANAAAASIAVAGLLTGRLTRRSRLPMAPFLAIGFVSAAFW